MKPIKLTSSNFDTEIESGKTVLVDFYADWCGPCQMIAPTLEELAKEMPEITVGKVNVDDENGLAGKFSVSSIPTLIVFKDGKPFKKAIGLQSKAQLAELLK